jgi:hypothetical protein
MMHAAPLSSPRLQRVLRLLRDGRPLTTRQIVRRAHVVAVNAIISELRHHGAEIACRVEVLPDGRGRRYYYTMTKEPDCG